MSSYPRPTETNVFNPIDYEHEPDEPEHEQNDDTYHDDSDHVNFLLKTGGHMSGSLSVPQLSFSDNTSQTSAFTTEKQTELETATTQIDILSNSIVAVDTKVNNITQNDITLKNVLADSFTSPGVSNLSQIESLGVSTSNLSVGETALFDKNVVCADLYCRNYSNGEQSRFATFNNWLYIQNNERIVFDQIANGVDPNVEINTSTGELKCESLIVQNNLNVSSPSLTVNGGLQINDNNASLIFEGSTGCYIEGKNTTRGRDWWMGVSGGDDITPNNFNITTLHGVDILLYPSGGGKVLCEGPLVGNSYIQADRNGEAIKMKGNHNYITGNNLNDERMFYIGTPNIDSTVLHIANTAVDGDINIKTTGTGKILLNNGDISNIVQDIEHLKEDVDIVLVQNSNTSSSSPTGSVIAFAGASPPAGWLLCNGQYVLKLEYADLYAVIGELYEFIGPVQNSLDSANQTSNFNHFRLPDLRQAYISGAGMQTTNFVKLTQPEKILGRFSDMSVQDHSHIYVSTNEQESASTGGVMTAQVGNDRKTDLKTSGIFHADGTIMSDGVTQPLNIAMNYIIKT